MALYWSATSVASLNWSAASVASLNWLWVWDRMLFYDFNDFSVGVSPPRSVLLFIVAQGGMRSIMAGVFLIAKLHHLR